ncbi:MAG: hypothetical protein AAFR65_08885 [Pseudomonadota bacterium]
MKRSILGSLVGGCLLLATADAATIVASVNQDARDNTNDDPIAGGIEQVSGPLDGRVDLSLSGADGVASTRGRLTVNPLTGVLASEAYADLETNLSGNNSARSSAFISITETFIATGSGTVTFNFAFDGGLAVDGTATSANVRAKLEASRFNPRREVVSDDAFYLSERDRDGAVRNTVDGVPTVPSSSLSVDDLLTVSIGANDGQRISLSLVFNIATAVSPNGQGGEASSDFFSTGYLSFLTSDGLTLTPSDPLFLSEASGVGPGAEVPIPAAGWMLLTGLGALLGRRRLS